MMVRCGRAGRAGRAGTVVRAAGALGLVVALSLAASACGSTDSSSAPASWGPVVSGPSLSDSRLLVVGLGANLDRVSSYRFSETIYTGADSGGGSGGASGGGAAAASASTVGPTAGHPASAAPSASPTGSGGPVGTASMRVTGTVVNGPTRSIQIVMPSVQYVIVGSKAWSTADGDIWAEVDDMADVLTLLPGAYYELWFDPNVGGFRAAGTETHNGVASTHFSGSEALGNLYAPATAATFQADLWIAADGSYPLGGRYLVPIGGHFSGFSFEITNVGDAANSVAAPTNVVALPS